MNRFQRLDTQKGLIKSIIEKLIEIGYKEVPNHTGGDEDFLMIDNFHKEFIWCENGFPPFCNDDDMKKYEFSKNPKDITLSKLEKERWENIEAEMEIPNWVNIHNTKMNELTNIIAWEMEHDEKLITKIANLYDITEEEAIFKFIDLNTLTLTDIAKLESIGIYLIDIKD